MARVLHIFLLELEFLAVAEQLLMRGLLHGRSKLMLYNMLHICSSSGPFKSREASHMPKSVYQLQTLKISFLESRLCKKRWITVSSTTDGMSKSTKWIQLAEHHRVDFL
jgi:hypothetical protein